MVFIMTVNVNVLVSIKMRMGTMGNHDHYDNHDEDKATGNTNSNNSMTKMKMMITIALTIVIVIMNFLGPSVRPSMRPSVHVSVRATVGDPSATGSLSGTRPGRLIRPPGDRTRAQESKMSRLQNVALYCDFSDYMSQLQQSATEMWHSASSPELGKKGPSLPELVKTKASEELSLAVASSTGNGRWKFSSCYGGRKKAPPDAAWTASGW
eukprot:s2876_g1.t3